MPPTDTAPKSAYPDLDRSDKVLFARVKEPAQGTKPANYVKASSNPASVHLTPSGYSYRAILLDADTAHAERLTVQVLRPQGLVVDHVRRVEEAIVKLQRSTNYYALVILNVSDNGLPWHRALQKLQHACQRANGQAVTLFLCVSKTQKETDFILRIEHMGARFVYER